MSVKLTVGMRSDIKDRLIEHKFKPLRDAMRKEEAELGMKVYEMAFMPRHRKMMDELPNGWLPETNAVYVAYGDSERFTQLALGKNVRLTHSKSCKSGALLALDPKSDLAVKIDSFVRRLQTLRDDRGNTEREVRSMLGAFRTLKQVEESWPEIKPFLKGLRPTTVSLPMVRLEDLNKKLGIAKAA